PRKRGEGEDGGSPTPCVSGEREGPAQREGEGHSRELHLGEGHRLAVEGRHDLLREGAQARDRGAWGSEQYVRDAAGLETLELRDDLFRRAEQGCVVEHERVLVLPDVRVMLGARAAGE